jgi:beta-galactosidase
LHEKDLGAPQPTAAYYGVTGVPTALLLDKEGKVVSLRARGGEREKLLERLIGPPYDTKGELTYIDLQPKANQKLTEKLHNAPDNDLKELPQGEQKFAGMRFRIGHGLIQLAGSNLEGRPQAVEGIQVNKRLTTLFFFHGTGWNPSDGTVIGQYRVHYADKTVETIPIVYGEDIRTWVSRLDPEPVTRGRVAWVGTNGSERRVGGTIRLYLGVWKNPHPEKKIISIDVISTNTVAAPFCVAITGEEATGPQTDQ